MHVPEWLVIRHYPLLASRLCSTGIFGTDALLQVLSSVTRSDLALEAVRGPRFPSFANMTSPDGNGTTLWESWLGFLQGQGSPEGSSRNHVMFGSAFPWLTRTVVGFSHVESLSVNGSAGFASMTCIPDAFAVYGFANAAGGRGGGSTASSRNGVTNATRSSGNATGNGEAVITTADADDVSTERSSGTTRGYSVTTPVRFASASVSDVTSDTAACSWTSHVPSTATVDGSVVQVNVTVPVSSTATACVPLPAGWSTGFVVVEDGAIVWDAVNGCIGTRHASDGILDCVMQLYEYTTLDGGAIEGVSVCYSLASGAYTFTVVEAEAPSVPPPAIAVVCAEAAVVGNGSVGTATGGTARAGVTGVGGGALGSDSVVSTADGGATTLTLDCTRVLGPAAVVSSVHFASYGLPSGVCGAYAFHRCHASDSRAVVEAACVGRPSCAFDVTAAGVAAAFGPPTPCAVDDGFFDAASLTLALQVTCVVPSKTPAVPQAGVASAR